MVAANEITDRLAPAPAADSHESAAGLNRIREARSHGAEVVAVVDGVPADSPQLFSALERVRTDLAANYRVAQVITPTPEAMGSRHANDRLVAADRDAVAVIVRLQKDMSQSDAEAVASSVKDRLHAITTDLPGSRVLVGGVLAHHEARKQVAADTRLSEAIALPITLVVMVVFFRGLAGAVVPVLAALGSIAGGLATLFAFTYFIDVESAVLSVTTVLGLGLAIDYSLLFVSRFREERAVGATPREAARRTGATAGRTVLFSGLVVSAALAGLLVFPSPVLVSIGAAGVGVVMVALAAALTLTPAVLGLLRRRIRPARHQLGDAPGQDDGHFARLARFARRRAVLVMVGVAALLLVAGLPLLHMTLVYKSHLTVLPPNLESRQAAEVTVERFPSLRSEPVIVVATADTGAVRQWARQWRGRPDVAAVGATESMGEFTVVNVTPREASAAEAVVKELRANRPPGQSWVTGSAAELLDLKRELVTYGPWAAVVVALATLVLLFFMTGSLLLPVKALAMNAMSLGVAFGALVFVFQDGHGAGLLGFTPPGGVEIWLPVVVFAFSFGLSTDYEVFLLARIKELYDSGMESDRAVEVGLQRSGRIITAAATLMTIVFLSFAAGKMIITKELGVALAIAVVVDATLVRCLLVPATMTVLGRWNWWAPAPLRRLHDDLSHVRGRPARQLR
ncbi:MMPL family transporter [Nocardiopsis gilva]|nr:MMPL family transporter [Nocardiopsis gilva]